MLGLIFFVLQKHVEQRLGPSGWSRSVTAANLPAKAYSPINEYPDDEAMALFRAASELTGQSLSSFLEEFGQALVPDLLAMHPGLVREEWRTLDLITNAEELIHAVVRRRNPEARPPVLRCARFSKDEVQLVYASQRKLCEIAKGIIRGVAQHYQETVSIVDQACMHRGDPFCEIQIRLIDGEARSNPPSESVTGVEPAQVPPSFHEQRSKTNPSAQFSTMWREVSPPDLSTFLARAGQLTAEQLSQVLCVDQRERWLRGERPNAEYYLSIYRSSHASSEYAVDILYNEFLARREIGEAPSIDEYRQRFPELVERLQMQISLSDALEPTASARDAEGEQPPLRTELSKAWPTLPGYEIIGELGRGGMGLVYKARQLSLRRTVAIKVITTESAAETGILARFRRERQLLAQLAHPNLVTAYDAGEFNGLQYFVMEFVDGVNLSVLVRRLGKLPLAAACEVIRQAAVGLQHIHERGLVHRDIKPSNLLLATSGTLKLIDLGLARSPTGLSQAENITTYRQLLGTFDYIAPEQCEDSHSVDIRADIYSLGCTFYELLAGQVPFAGAATVLMKLRAHAQDPVPPIRERRSDVPEPVAAALQRMLAKDRGDRFASPAYVAAALQPFVTGADLRRLLQ